MSSVAKRIKLSTLSGKNTISENDSGSAGSIDQGADSAYQSQSDFTNSVDFSLRTTKARALNRHSSFHNKDKRSIELSDHGSIGYSSLSSTLSPGKKPRSPKKRKLEATVSDENAFHESYQFASPLKIRKRDEANINCAKLVLREKSSSENVIRCSTPIRDGKNKFGRFRSLHPEKLKISESVEEAEFLEKTQNLPSSANASFDIGSSLNFTSSFNLTNIDKDIPCERHQLWTGAILDVEAANTQSQEDVEPIQSPKRIRYHCGRLKMDILGALHKQGNLALDMILSHFSDVDLLSLSHVSKDYSSMIKSKKTLEAKRQTYLTAHQIIKENKLPGSLATSLPKPFAAKNRKRTLGDSNVNHSMQLRSKPPSPPVSPSRKRFHENQKVESHCNQIHFPI